MMEDSKMAKQYSVSIVDVSDSRTWKGMDSLKICKEGDCHTLAHEYVCVAMPKRSWMETATKYMNFRRALYVAGLL